MPKSRNASMRPLFRLTRTLPILLLLTLLQSTVALAGQNRSRDTGPQPKSTDKLYVVYLDLSSMDTKQRQSFATYLETAHLPKTAVGKKCIYYGRPQNWCLILHRQEAAETFIKLKAESFGKAAKVKPVNRVGADR